MLGSVNTAERVDVSEPTHGARCELDLVCELDRIITQRDRSGDHTRSGDAYEYHDKEAHE